MEELRRLLTQRLEAVPGLLALVVSDRDGVPIIKASVDHNNVIDNCFRFETLTLLCFTNRIIQKQFFYLIAQI